MNQSKSLFLSLLRAALWGEKPDASAFAEADWKQIFRLADTQTVPLLVLDGMGMLPKECLSMPLGDKMKRIAQMQQMENVNRLHRQVIVKIDKALKAEGIQAVFMMADIMRVGNFGRGEYVFSQRGWLDAWRNYRWVARRCWMLGFVCKSEARWWMVSKVTRFFWKKAKVG